jgi:hypothetical protein
MMKSRAAWREEWLRQQRVVVVGQQLKPELHDFVGDTKLLWCGHDRPQ